MEATRSRQGIAPGRIASLDGVRGLSIWAVLLAHVADHYVSNPRENAALHLLLSPAAAFGVNTFFVISGFLITFLLLRERQKSGSVRLGRFYKRRALRILPAFLLYVAAVLSLGHATGAQIAYALTFTSSYFFEHTYKPLQQLWTLSVEEQFYLLWPLCMLLGPRMAKRVCWGVLLASPMLREFLLRTHRYELLHSAPAQADMIAVGCLLAFYLPRVQELVRRHLLSTPRFVAALLLTSVFTVACYRFNVVTCFGVASLGIALVLAAAVERQDALLNRGPLVWSGLLSYSLYLWQQPLLVLGGPLDRVYVRLPLTFTLAWFSYAFVEQPMLRCFSRTSAALNRVRPLPAAEGQLHSADGVSVQPAGSAVV